MKRVTFVILVLVLWLSTCSAPQPEIPAPDVNPIQMEISNPPGIHLH